jgi:hypothetical protein
LAEDHEIAIVRRIQLLASFAALLLAVGLLVASSASAEATAKTCEPAPLSGFGDYNDEHCTTSGGFDDFKRTGFIHFLITLFTGTNSRTASSTTAAEVSKLSGTLSGLETEIQCTGVSSSGSMENSETAASGTGTIFYSGCTVTKPAGRGCTVKGGSVTTKTLKGSTAGQTGTNLKVEANSGTELASVTLENCLNNKPPNTSYPVAGSLVAPTSGATATTTVSATKAAGTLTFGGNPAGLEGATTLSGENGNPLLLN